MSSSLRSPGSLGRMLASAASVFAAAYSAPAFAQAASPLPYPPPAWRVTDPVYTTTYTAAEKSNQADDGVTLQNALNAAVSAGATQFTIPTDITTPLKYNGKVFRIASGQLLAKTPHNFTINAPGVEIISTGHSGTSLIELHAGTTNFTIKGAPGNPMVFDADPLPFSQGQIMAIDNTADTVDIQVMTGYSVPAIGDDLPYFRVFDAGGIWVSGHIATNEPGLHMSNVSYPNSTYGYIRVGVQDAQRGYFKVGSYVNWKGILVPFLSASNDSSTSGVTVQDVQTYCEGGIEGIVSGTGQITRYRAMRRPGTNRLLGGGGHSGFQTSGANSSVTYDGCELSFSDDDTIDARSGQTSMIYSATSPITSNTIITHGYNFNIGEKVRIFHYPSGDLVGDATIMSVTSDGADESAAETQASQIHGSDVYSNDHCNSVVLDKTVTVSGGDVICNLSRRCQNFTITNSYIHDGGVSLRLSHANGTFTGNVFERQVQGIQMGFDFNDQYGAVWDTATVTNNYFADTPYDFGKSGSQTSAVSYAAGNAASSKYLFGALNVNNNTFIGGQGEGIKTSHGTPVTINNNLFLNTRSSSIDVANTGMATIQGNRIIDPDGRSLDALYNTAIGSHLTPVVTPAIRMSSTTNATVTGNNITGLGQGTNPADAIVATGSSNSNINISGNSASAAMDTIDNLEGFDAGSSGLTFGGSPVPFYSNDSLVLTDGQHTNVAASAFAPQKVNVSQFSTTFDFQFGQGKTTGSAPSSGFTFCIQNVGATAVGGTGGDLGYKNIGNASVAVKFDIGDSAGEGTDSVGLYKNGAAPYGTAGSVDLSSTGIQFLSGHVFSATLNYDGASLQLTITDTNTGSKYVVPAFTVNIPSVVGSSTAYVGFTASCSTGVAVQTVFDWVYLNNPPVLPTGWTVLPLDIDAGAAAASFSANQWTVSSSAGYIGQSSTFYYSPDNSDSFYGDEVNLVAQWVQGDQTFVAKVTGITSSDSDAEAGLMVRPNADAVDGEASIVVSKAGKVTARAQQSYNDTSIDSTAVTTRPPTAATPVWVRLVKTGSSYDAGYSYDGVSWTHVATRTCNTRSSYYAGLVVQGDDSSATATFTNVSVPGGGLNYSAGFGSVTGLTLNGGATSDQGALVLSPSGADQSSSVFASAPANVQTFSTTFDVRFSNSITFCIQNSPQGANALGLKQSGLGYQSITKSVAVKFDLYDSAGEGTNSTGLYTNGAAPTVPATDLTPSGIDLKSGHPFRVTMDYDGTTLTVKETDLTTGVSATQPYTINIPTTVTANTAYVGFTGGNGTTGDIHTILDWTY